MLYQISNATVSLGGEEILSHIDFEIHGTEKIAITGRNGAGKTTLLRFIAGELSADRDDKRTGPAIHEAHVVNIAMLRQTNEAYGEVSARELCTGKAMDDACRQGDDAAAEDGAECWEFERIFTGMGFDKEDEDRPLNSFSGGEQTKISLIRLLLAQPDILLLDEPTNHLDMRAVEWLEEYLRHYPKAVVLVSHDRFFMDRVADVVYEVSNKRLTRYVGNYTEYREQHRKNLEQQQKAWEKNEREKEKLTELIKQFRNKPSKAAFAHSRETMLARLPKLEKPGEQAERAERAERAAHIFVKDIVPEELGAKWVVNAEHLKCGYRSGNNVVVELSMKLQRGYKVAIVGDNGAGKSTFLKTVVGKLRPLDGKCTIGNRVTIGYFDQQSAELQSDKTVIEHFAKQFPAMNDRDLHTTLALYLFKGADAYKKVSDLSGGEKARLVLAEMLTSKPNFLVLDEPTNHMDIDAKETLESAFKAYKGTILLVSHDRYLVSRLAEAFYIFEDGRAFYYPFDYEHYLERLERLETARRVNGYGASIGASMDGAGVTDVAMRKAGRMTTRTGAADVQSEIMGLVTAEDEAIIQGLKAVPKKERHEIGFKSTEEAHEDWQLRLTNDDLEEARRRVEEAKDFDEYETAVAALTKLEERLWELQQ